MIPSRMQAYKNAGVDIDAGNTFVSRIKSIITEIHSQQKCVMSDIGGFGGLFKLDLGEMREPILVSSTDGVGTKLKFAFEFSKHTTVGIDLVAMCVNDIIVQGAQPLFFLDYFATSKLNIEVAEDVIRGIATGCKQAKCSLIGGETAELPGMYLEGEYDLAGFCVGIVDNKNIVDGSSIKVGDTIIGIASSGIHANGYSLVRKIFKEYDVKPDTIVPGSTKTFQDVLLEPTKIYVDIVKFLMRELPINGMAHITGGGLYDNIQRILPSSVIAKIFFDTWKMDPIFYWLKEQGNLTWPEMLQVYNCSIGYVLIVSQSLVSEFMNKIQAMDINAWIIGSIDKRSTEEEQVIVNFS